VVTASGQNVFFGEILDAFAAALRARGLTVEESVDEFPPPADDLVYLFVPHEYHPLVHVLAHPTPLQLRRSIAICTEQPGSSWFDTSAGLAALVGAAVDINRLGVEELARRGVEVRHAPLGYVPAWDAWQGEEAQERSVDFTFLGAATSRRETLLSGCAHLLTHKRSEIHLVETATPHTARAPSFLSGEAKWNLLADTRILLNVHQENRPYMEWHRIIGAAINGCVVLSEHSLATDPFVPGEHFVSASYEHVPAILAGLLDDHERLWRIRHAAYDLLREQMPIDDAVDALLWGVERAAGAPVTGAISPPTGPLPLAPKERKPAWETEAEAFGGSRPLRTALKHLVGQTRKLDRQLQSLKAETRTRDEVAVERFGPPRKAPRVSVLLTIYNYADYVDTALRSVALGELDEVEVIAVDDASSDHSTDAVAKACERYPWLSVRLLRRSRNAGLSAARNLAAEHASSDLLFILDADNAVLPRGLRVLAEALEQNPDAAFSYGLIEAFSQKGPAGVVSWLDWDPGRLRFGNYIDAMAMIRRSALKAVGGYSTEGAFSMGWEDFALWVAMAHHGMDAVWVPEFVGRYRVNPHSMLSLTDIDHSAVWAALLRKYPSLAAVDGRPA
jgi:Glycosyl transferase family 2